jgi:hypothetical protein
LGRQFDIVQCLEVAEHVAPESSCGPYRQYRSTWHESSVFRGCPRSRWRRPYQRATL